MKLKAISLTLLALLLMVPLVRGQGEDISTFTEVDPNNHIDYDASTVNFTYYCNEDAYLYKDYGAAYFENFTHEISANWLTKSGASFQRSMIWLVSNDLDDAKGLDDNSKDYLGLSFTYTAGAHRIQLVECDGGTLTFDNYIGSLLNTWYYFTIIHLKGQNITCEIYSDYARTTLLDTLAVTGLISTTFRYIHVANTWNNGQNRWGTERHMNLTFWQRYYITFYFITEGGQFRVAGSSIANATQNDYQENTVLDLAAVPKNRSWFFMNYTWTGGYNDTNPYAFTVTANNTIWLNFVDPIIAGKEVAEDNRPVLLVGALVVAGGGIMIYWLLKGNRS